MESLEAASAQNDIRPFNRFLIKEIERTFTKDN